MTFESGAVDRIARIRQRYCTQAPRISVERARLYTRSWQQTEGRGLPPEIRVAQAMKAVYEGMHHYLDPDDRIAGNWTESFFGIPVDIERGVFNQVLEAELSTWDMLRHRGKTLGRAVSYLTRKRAVVDFVRNQVRTRRDGHAPLDTGLRTMSQREINPYEIDDDDRRELTKELLPYWHGRTLCDALEEDLRSSGLYSQDMHEFVVGIPGNTSRQVMMVSTCSTIACIQGHVILDYERVLKRGLRGMHQDLEKQVQAAEAGSAQRTSLEAQAMALEGVMIFSKRLAEHIKSLSSKTDNPQRRKQLQELSDRCRRVPIEPAASFRQAVQALWTVKTAVELAHPVNLHCFGRLDQNLGPYYERDLAVGRIEEHQARELLEELLLKIMSQNIRPESGMLSNFYHRFLGSSPVTVGGLNRDGKPAENSLTRLFVEAAHRSRAITNLSVRVHEDTPSDLLDAVADYLAQGTSSYSLYNDEVHIAALENRGIATEDARDYAIMGCVEATIPGKTGSMSANALQLMRLLDISLRDGDSHILAGPIRGEGLPTGKAEDHKDFESLMQAVFAQADHAIGKIAQASNLRDRLTSEILPAPLISAFMDGCAESGKDVTRGGARYDLSGISLINSIANMTDSLYAIQKLVFEQHKFSLPELMRALDDNYQGHEHILRAIRKLPGKWGNGNPECDALARRIAQHLSDTVHSQSSFKGGPFVVYYISMITHTIDGRLSMASPDGRLAGTPFAASCNPANVERAGVTATLRSVAALPFEDMLGAAVNVRFHPSAVGQDELARSKWTSLLRTYFSLGGCQMQPTCASAETLREAQANPDQHRDLIIKVGGYSTYFVDLGREIQQEIIERTEHGCPA